MSASFANTLIALSIFAGASAVAQDTQRLAKLERYVGGYATFEGPEVVLYADGTMIYAVGGRPTTFRIGRVEEVDLSQFEERTKTTGCFYDLASRIRNTAATDAPAVEVTLYSPDGPHAVSVLGDWSSGENNDGSSNVPRCFREILVSLLKMRPAESEVWKPRQLQLRLAKTELPPNARPADWPVGWPKLGDAKVKRIRDYALSIDLPTAQRQTVERMFATSPYVSTGESIWVLADLQAKLP